MNADLLFVFETVNNMTTACTGLEDVYSMPVVDYVGRDQAFPPPDQPREGLIMLVNECIKRVQVHRQLQ